MHRECELLGQCGFFKKYKNAGQVLTEGFIRTYCRGARQVNCERKKYRREKGQPPGDDMMPNGQDMPK